MAQVCFPAGPSSYQIEPSITPKWLDWTQRFDSIKKMIDKALIPLLSQFQSGWGVFNGAVSYGLCGVDERALLKKLILDAYPDRKEFYILDVGAGNFQWSKSMADYIEKEANLPKDIKVHIIGIRGEGYLGNRVVETERCKIYNYGAFKVEELFEQFKKEHGLDLVNKVDLAVSHWCIRHLVDPVGTALQIYNLLRPKTGYFLFDGFFFLLENQTMKTEIGNARMNQLLLDMKAPFITRRIDVLHSLNQFILRRPDEKTCQLPMSYLGVQVVDGHSWQIGSDCVTQFRREPQATDQTIQLPAMHSKAVYGNDKKLHDWLKENELMYSEDYQWKPVHEKDNHLTNPPLHQAMEKEDLEAVKLCLTRGDDINESDGTGSTALHIAIRKKSFPLFQLLLSRGAHVGLPDGKGMTPLHLAAECDAEGVFVQALIDKTTNIKALYKFKTVIDCAIDAKNPNAVEILIKAGAEILDRCYRALKDPVFSSLKERNIIPEQQYHKGTERGAYADVYAWIKQGDYVILHQNSNNAIAYYYPREASETDVKKKIPKVRIVDINPRFNVLHDTEWPDYLKVNGFEYKPYRLEEVKKAGLKIFKRYSFAYGL